MPNWWGGMTGGQATETGLNLLKMAQDKQNLQMEREKFDWLKQMQKQQMLIDFKNLKMEQEKLEIVKKEADRAREAFEIVKGEKEEAKTKEGAETWSRTQAMLGASTPGRRPAMSIQTPGGGYAPVPFPGIGGKPMPPEQRGAMVGFAQKGDVDFLKMMQPEAPKIYQGGPGTQFFAVGEKGFGKVGEVPPELPKTGTEGKRDYYELWLKKLNDPVLADLLRYTEPNAALLNTLFPQNADDITRMALTLFNARHRIWEKDKDIPWSLREKPEPTFDQALNEIVAQMQQGGGSPLPSPVPSPTPVFPKFNTRSEEETGPSYSEHMISPNQPTTLPKRILTPQQKARILQEYKKEHPELTDKQIEEIYKAEMM
jgi:hypothetical protein